jgi:hypothetical protein
MLKRSGFKQKLTKPLKRTKLAKKGKSDIRKIQDLLWQECRRITLNKYEKNGKHYCFTCDKEVSGSNRQLGHFIPNSVGGALLRYNLDNLRIQCYYDNINLGGNGSEFYRRLVKENGEEFVEKLFALKGQTTKAIDHYTKLLNEYKEL